MGTAHSTETAEVGRIDGAAGIGREYLTFQLAGEEYGVSILDVQEIRAWERVIQLPNSPAYIKGVLNLRGVIVPVVDLRARFGFPTQNNTPTTVLIVLKIESEDGVQIIGVVVDAVCDVIAAADEQLKLAPDFSVSPEEQFIKGLVNHHAGLVILLHTDKLLSHAELSCIRKHAEAGTMDAH